MPKPIKVSIETKREAHQLALALREVIDYPDRTVVGGLLALCVTFLHLCEDTDSGDATAAFKACRMVLEGNNDDMADDPCLRGYVMPPHDSLQ